MKKIGFKCKWDTKHAFEFKNFLFDNIQAKISQLETFDDVKHPALFIRKPQALAKNCLFDVVSGTHIERENQLNEIV